MKRHKHIWKKKQRGHGLAPKQNMLNPIIYDGVKAECDCGKVMFFPDNPNLRPVEIEQEKKK